MHKSRPEARPTYHIHRIARGDADYPQALLGHLGERAPEELTAFGDLSILRRNNAAPDATLREAPPTLAFFCSARCPRQLAERIYHLALHVRAARLTAVGGFHSPMERHFLTVLLRGVQPTILCPAQSLTDFSLTPECQQALAQGRLLVLSPYANGPRRVTVEAARYRNWIVAALADRIFVAYARPGGRTERLCRETLSWGKLLYTFEDEANASLIALGGTAITPQVVSTWA